jgi:hypothetical protein
MLLRAAPGPGAYITQAGYLCCCCCPSMVARPAAQCIPMEQEGPPPSALYGALQPPSGSMRRSFTMLPPPQPRAENRHSTQHAAGCRCQRDTLCTLSKIVLYEYHAATLPPPRPHTTCFSTLVEGSASRCMICNTPGASTCVPRTLYSRSHPLAVYSRKYLVCGGRFLLPAPGQPTVGRV